MTHLITGVTAIVAALHIYKIKVSVTIKVTCQ